MQLVYQGQLLSFRKSADVGLAGSAYRCCNPDMPLIYISKGPNLRAIFLIYLLTFFAYTFQQISYWIYNHDFTSLSIVNSYTQFLFFIMFLLSSLNQTLIVIYCNLMPCASQSSCCISNVCCISNHNKI